MSQKDRRKEKGDKTKKRILGAVLRIIMEEGKDGLTTRNIAEKARVGKGSIYHHFENIEDLLYQSFSMMIDFYLEDIDSRKFNNIKELVLFFGSRGIEMVKQFIDMGRGSISIWEMVVNSEFLTKKVKEKNLKFYEKLEQKIVEIVGKEPDYEKLRRSVLALTTFGVGIETFLYLVDDYDQFLKMWSEVAVGFEQYILSAFN